MGKKSEADKGATLTPKGGGWKEQLLRADEDGRSCQRRSSQDKHRERGIPGEEEEGRGSRAHLSLC